MTSPRQASRRALRRVRGPLRALARRGRTEADWLRSRRGRADLAVFHEFVPASVRRRSPVPAALVGELRARGLAVEENRISGGTPACLFNSFNFDFHRLRRFSRERCAHGAPCRRADRRLSRLRRRHRRASPRSTARWPTPPSSSRSYSLERHLELGLELRNPVVIPNAVDPTIFHPPAARTPLAGPKLRIVATSWSDNPRKGADTLRWLDEHLDVERLRAHVRRPDLRSTFERRARRRPASRRSRSPSFSAATTSTSPRAATIPARTRCSRRSRAGSLRRTCAAAAIPSSSVRAASGSTTPRSFRACSTGSPRRSTSGAPRSASRAARGRGRPLPRGAARVTGTLGAPCDRLADSLPARRSRHGHATGRPPLASSSSATAAAGRSTTTRSHVAEIARRLGYEVAPVRLGPHAQRQAVFLPSHFSALRPRWLDSSHRLGLAYFHGRPGTAGHPEFDEAYRHAAATRWSRSTASR